MKNYTLVTNYIDKDLEKLRTKNAKEWTNLKSQLSQLEASGDLYPYTSERKYRGLKTKYYRILYKVYGAYVVCLVLDKKQGQKFENYHFKLADKRDKEFNKQYSNYKNNK